MSVYALPGPLYPPLQHQQKHHHHPNNPAPFKVTLCYPERKKQCVLLDISKVEIDTSLASPPMQTLSDSTADSSLSTSTCTSSKHDQHLRIQVKEAMVDFHKLVRPSASPSSKSRLTGSRRQRYGRLQRRQEQQQNNDQASRSIDQLDTYESALEFDLVISFVGRTYSTKRSLQQIAQLRQDLVEDLQIQQQWIERRNKQAAANTGFCYSDDSSCSSTGSSSTGTSSEIIMMDDSTMSISGTTTAAAIPELPRMTDEIMGGYGCGFAQMNGMLRSYRPALERWFHRLVMAVSEDSPLLADFLWEPLSTKCMDELHSGLNELGSIDE